MISKQINILILSLNMLLNIACIFMFALHLRYIIPNFHSELFSNFLLVFCSKEMFLCAYRDGDSILDIVDNCPSYPNADQSDIDSDGTGWYNSLHAYTWT